MLRFSPTRTIIRGDSDRFQITFNKKVNNRIYPIDITGWDIKFTVRPDVPPTEVEDDSEAIISAQAEILDAEKGSALVYVQSDETTKINPGEYLYDVQVMKPADEDGHRQVCSIRRGKYIVLGDITRQETYNANNHNNPIVNDNLNDFDDEELDDADDGYTI